MLYSVLCEVPGIEQASPSGGCHCRAMFLLIWYMLAHRQFSFQTCSVCSPKPKP